MMRYYLVLMLCLGYLCSWAQPYASTKGSFQVDQRRGCAPFTINLTQLISSSFTAEYNYEGGTTLTLSKTHTYNNPGTYNLLAIYNGLIPNSTDNTDNITVVVTENVQPEFEISSCSNNQISIKVLETKYNKYLVDFNNDNVVDSTIPGGGNQSAAFQYASSANQTITVRGQDNNGADNCAQKSLPVTPLVALPAATINALTVVDNSSIQLDYVPARNIQYRGLVATDNGSFQIFQTFNSAVNTQQSLTLSSITTDNNYYCFLLNSYDPCNNTNIPSNTICSANLDLNIISNVNQLSWTTNVSGIANFTVKRDQANYQTTVSTNYNDAAPAIVCNADYCYQIITNYTNGTRSNSLEKCGTAFSGDTPTAIENSSAVVNGESVNLDWVQDPLYSAQSYSVYRSISNGLLNSIGSTNATTYTDDTFSITASYCYSINYLDVCDNVSPNGVLICPIILSGFVTSENFVNLNWTEYTGWKNGVMNYRVTKYDINGNQLATFNTIDLSMQDNAEDPDHQVVAYQVTAFPNDAALTNSVSNVFRITKQARLIFPTAFTPNKDKLNDSFTVIGQYVDNMTLQIFDRWGTLIFSTTSNEPWDGTQQGRLMPESTYVWKALITDKTGRASTKIGSVALLRK